MANKRLTKKVSKLEKQAEELRKKAEKKAGALQDMANERIDDLTGETEKKRGRKRLAALVVALGAGAAVALKKKRDQELDEALWEEPRSV
jgi:hypothetical protein